MKRLLALLLALVLAVSLCACADKDTDKKDKDNTEETVAETSAETSEPQTTAPEQNEKIDVETLLGDCIDFSAYTKGTDTYSREDMTYNFDKTITIESKQFSIPCAYSELKAAGFTYSGDESSQIEGSENTTTVTGNDAISYEGLGFSMNTPNDGRVSITVYNTSSEAKALSECDAYEFSFDTSDNTDFSYSGLTAKSTAKDFVDKLGAPSKITPYTGMVVLDFSNDVHNRVNIQIDENGNIIRFSVESM